MFSPSRSEARRFFVAAWAKYRAGAPLEGLERQVALIAAMHPEYHRLLDDGERHVDRDYAPASGEVNPYLHLSLHLAVAEQLTVDQPPGIRSGYEALRSVRGDEHAALHDVMECLAETLWQAQRAGGAPDAGLYLANLAGRCRKAGVVDVELNAAGTGACP